MVNKIGSNQNKFGDKKGPDEWGSRGRKQEAHQKKHSRDLFAISDSLGDGKPVGNIKKQKKDTKKWCRGKEGREHVWVLIETNKTWYDRCFQRFQCEGCQKMKYRRAS